PGTWPWIGEGDDGAGRTAGSLERPVGVAGRLGGVERGVVAARDLIIGPGGVVVLERRPPRDRGAAGVRRAPPGLFATQARRRRAVIATSVRGRPRRVGRFPLGWCLRDVGWPREGGVGRTEVADRFGPRLDGDDH